MESLPEVQEQLTTPEEFAAQVAQARDITYEIVDDQCRLLRMPREVLVEIAWRGIAHYQREGITWGFDNPSVERLEQVKNYRMSLLTPEEQESAASKANSWLDDNFDK